MARILCNGNTKVAWVSTIASIAAPTATELNAGVMLDTLITPDGLNLDITDAEVDASVLSSDSEYSFPGTYKVTCAMTFQRDSTTGTDLAWTTLTRNAAGYLVVRRNVAASGAFASGDKIEVYTMTCGKRVNNPPAKNALQTAKVTLFNSGASTDSAVAAA